MSWQGGFEIYVYEPYNTVYDAWTATITAANNGMTLHNVIGRPLFNHGSESITRRDLQCAEMLYFGPKHVIDHTTQILHILICVVLHTLSTHVSAVLNNSNCYL